MAADNAKDQKAAPASKAKATKEEPEPAAAPQASSSSSAGWLGAVARSALPAAALVSVILVVAFSPFERPTTGPPKGRSADWERGWEGGPADWAAADRRLQTTGSGGSTGGQCAEQVIPMPSPDDAVALQCATCGVPFVEPNHTCRFNISSCIGVTPGGTCNITCAAPFVGNGTIVGTCPEGNSNFGRLLSLDMPISALECGCPQPPAVAGYVQDLNGEWLCAEGYAGKASVMCSCDRNGSWLEGCALRVPCAAPSVDLCRYDVSSCVSVEPGATCEVRCRHPFIGGPTVATCNISNTDPLKELDYFPLRCTLEQCQEPDPFPQGYNKTTDGKWTCATGYAGTALAQCAPGTEWSADCSATMQLTGCLPIVPCQAPALEGMDACKYDVSACQNVADGSICEVHCKAPFLGISKEASCPTANTDPNGLIWERPDCQLTDCNDPEAPPRGYALKSDGWKCDFAYSGFANKNCEALPSCEIIPVLSGCIQQLPCEAPVAHCRYDVSYCQSIQPGETCRIGCKEPYSGGEVTAACPVGNTASDGLLVSSWPECVTEGCADPYPWPEGYRRKGAGEWECDEGWNGTVVKTCVEPPDGSCEALPELSGCQRLQPCAPLTIPDAELCRYNTSLCSASLQPGASCPIQCKVPYFGTAGSVSCPVGNTNTSTPLIRDMPDCDCEDPISIPPGYFRSNVTGEWACAPGYAGSAMKLCLPGADCTAEPSLTGCMAPVVCEASDFIDDGSGQGILYGDVAFGPALILGKIDEEMIAGYSVYFGDECNMSIGKEVAYIDKHADGQPCCRNDTYRVRLMGKAAPTGSRGLVIKAWLKPDPTATTTTSAPDGPPVKLEVEAPVGLFIPLSPTIIVKRAMTGAASQQLPAVAVLALAALAAVLPGGPDW